MLRLHWVLAVAGCSLLRRRVVDVRTQRKGGRAAAVGYDRRWILRPQPTLNNRDGGAPCVLRLALFCEPTRQHTRMRRKKAAGRKRHAAM